MCHKCHKCHKHYKEHYIKHKQYKQMQYYDKKHQITSYASYLPSDYTSYTPPVSQHLWNRFWATSKFYNAY
jgi:hypothetical protein